MEYNMTEILIRIAHISELLKGLSVELDKMYDAISKKAKKTKGD